MLRSHLGVLGLRKSAKRAFEQGSADWSFKSALWDALLDWHLDQNTESILFLTNESNQPARIGFQVTTQGIHYYLTQLKLQPHETRAINIRLLRDVQLADFRRIFPRSNEGKLLCRRELGEFESQDVVMLFEYLS